MVRCFLPKTVTGAMTRAHNVLLALHLADTQFITQKIPRNSSPRPSPAFFGNFLEHNKIRDLLYVMEYVRDPVD